MSKTGAELKITMVVFVTSDPVRPKLDKGTILAESILAVNELRSNIDRMKSENIALSDESRDVRFHFLYALLTSSVN